MAAKGKWWSAGMKTSLKAGLARPPYITGVSNLQDLVPDDLRWSWCNNNRNKAHNKCNALESSPNHSTASSLWKTCLPQKHSLVPKRLRTADLQSVLCLGFKKIIYGLQLMVVCVKVVCILRKRASDFEFLSFHGLAQCSTLSWCWAEAVSSKHPAPSHDHNGENRYS